MSKYFDVPWATSGDKTAIPNATQPGGEVSYTEGWTLDYELDQVTEPTAKDVERQKENQFKFDVTEFLKLVQENGLPLYDATYNYVADAYTIGSDGNLYRSLIVNGPATTVRDPVTDATGWIRLGADVIDYSATYNYRLTDYAKGSDGVLYRAAIVNGPATSVVDPVGDITGTWIIVGGVAKAMEITVITASDPVWAPSPLAKSLKVYVTGGGGGAGGLSFSSGSDPGASAGGGAGGTAIKVIQAPLSATYAVVVGAKGVGASALAGTDGVDSSFDVSVIGEGGTGGVLGIIASGDFINLGANGGGASGGDLNLSGGESTLFQGLSGLTVVERSLATGSYYGGAISSTAVGVGADGTDANQTTWGAGGGASSGGGITGSTAGGDGAPGVVIIEEYF